MPSYEDIPGVAMQVSREILVASIQVDLDDDVMARFRDDLLRRLHETGSRGVILDLSGLETLDTEEFVSLRRIITMTTVMGAESILVGMRPGIVSSLIEANADVDGLRAAIDLDAAFDWFLSETGDPSADVEEVDDDADAQDAAETASKTDPGQQS
jgi:rsbT antagonist protein RsbS